MRIRFRYLMAAGAVSAMIGAPTAVAGQQQSCSAEGPWGTDVVCSSPGNVQINDSLPVWGAGFGGYSGGFYAGGPYAVPFAR